MIRLLAFAILLLALPIAGAAQPPPPQVHVKGTMSSLLQHVPVADDESSQLVRYTNIDLWLDLHRNNADLTPQDVAVLPLPEAMVDHGFDPIWLETYGFSLDEIDQILVSGENVTSVLVLRGRWHELDLFGIWAQHGYQAVAVDSYTVWTVHPFDEDVISFANPASRLSDGMLNNLVMLEDGTLIATSTFEHLKRVIGTGDTLGENEQLGAYLTSASSPMVLSVLAFGGPELDDDQPEVEFAIFADFLHESTQEVVTTLNLVANSEDDAADLRVLMEDMVNPPWTIRRSVIWEERLTLVLDYERPPILWSRVLSEPLFLITLQLID